jgi:hypothetical protein
MNIDFKLSILLSETAVVKEEGELERCDNWTLAQLVRALRKNTVMKIAE